MLWLYSGAHHGQHGPQLGGAVALFGVLLVEPVQPPQQLERAEVVLQRLLLRQRHLWNGPKGNIQGNMLRRDPGANQ
eukprot:2729626-Pyramimonas_sp.AAC.2